MAMDATGGRGDQHRRTRVRADPGDHAYPGTQGSVPAPIEVTKGVAGSTWAIV